MNVLQITNEMTWKEFEHNLVNSNPTDKITTNTPSSFSRRFCAAFTRRSDVADKVTVLIKQKLIDHLKENFGVEYTLNEKVAIDATFDQLMLECGVNYQSLKTVGQAIKVFQKIDQNVIECAETLFPIAENEVAVENKSKAQLDAENIVKLLCGGPLNLKAISARLIIAVLIRRDKKRMQALSQELQKVSQQVYRTHLCSDNINPNQEKLAEIFLGNILALYPFTEPEPGSTLEIPQKIENKWQIVTYRVDVLPLTAPFLGAPVCALALSPNTRNGASPLLLFRGTPHPTASGSLLAMLSDIIPGLSVGEITYGTSARLRINQWIDTAHTDFGKIKIYGQSLGGSLSLLVVSRHLDKVKEVHAYGSPSLTRRSMKIYNQRRTSLSELPRVHIYWNNKDYVPLAGRGFHQDWHLHKVFIPAKQASLLAHASLNTAYPKVIVMKINQDIDRQRRERRIFNIFHEVMSVLLMPITCTLGLLLILKASTIKICSKVITVSKKCFKAMKK